MEMFYSLPLVPSSSVQRGLGSASKVYYNTTEKQQTSFTQTGYAKNKVNKTNPLSHLGKY